MTRSRDHSKPRPAAKRSRELSRLSAGPQVYAAKFTDSPEQTWLLRRGDPMQRTEPMEPAIPLVLGRMDYHLTKPKSSGAWPWPNT